MTYKESKQRQNEIRELVSGGMTYKDVGGLFGVSKQRVQQILVTDYKKREVCKSFLNQPVWRGQGRERVRFLVRERDNFTCQSCEKKWKDGERQFDVHHLGGMCGKKTKSYDKKEDMDKLITLCHKCHFNHPEHSFNL